MMKGDTNQVHIKLLISVVNTMKKLYRVNIIIASAALGIQINI